jgi:hypothetical protein
MLKVIDETEADLCVLIESGFGPIPPNADFRRTF